MIRHLRIGASRLVRLRKTRKENTLREYVSIYDSDIRNSVAHGALLLGTSNLSSSLGVWLFSLGIGLLSGIGAAWWMIQAELKRLAART
jgi:hypothetical protein